MNAAVLKLELEKKFDIVCFYDLAEVLSSHRKIFDVFKQHHQPVFDHRQRLIFYTDFEPSQRAIDHLQRAALQIDISNYFIAVCSPHNIQSLLDSANKKYSNDNTAIQWIASAACSTLPLSDHKIYSSDTFCSLPFSALSLSVDGIAFPCCKYSIPVGSVNSHDIVEIFNNPQMQRLREDIKNGVQHKHCKVCWDIEHTGGTSYRIHLNNKYQNRCDQGWIDDVQIRDITFSPSTLCNFKCRICLPDVSSKIAVEELQFATDPTIIKKLKSVIKLSELDSTMLNQILKITSGLEFVHILGGEPFKWHDLDALIDRLIETGHAKNIQIEFNTNGSIFSKSIIDKLQQFKATEILISIDDIGDRFELQRGGVWIDVLNNINRFKQCRSSTFDVKIAVTVNIQNLLYLDQVVEFCQTNDLEIVWWFLEDPAYLCIDCITETAKDLVRQKYATHSDSELRSIVDRVSKTPSVSGELFVNYMRKLDQRRRQDSSIVLKEIFDAMLS
jgi:MoaA/NifB/PqqE/SkfB family radical SAM enzyme